MDSFLAVRLFIRLSRPLFLLGAALLYALGVGVANYLGFAVDWRLYILGQAWVTSLQLSTHYLNEYFDAPIDANNPNRTPFSGGSGALEEGKLPREIALWSAVGALAIATTFTLLLMNVYNIAPSILLLMFIIFLGAFFYSTPPVQLMSSGYGELTTSIIVANLVPALGFILQTGELHRLIAMSTFPLTPLHLAMMLTFELPDYATDVKYDKYTLLVRLGWKRGMTLHNLLILIAFLLLGLSALFGLPGSIAFPAYFALPLGIFQIWYMSRIAAGAKPNWTVLSLTAIFTFGLTAYLLAFAFWTA
jgi:1,4-dihydroxy-2-naphthoate octaprenyltransferase